MIKWFFKGVYARIDVFVFAILMLIYFDLDNYFILLLFIPWAGVSGVIEKRCIKNKESENNKC